LIASRSIIVDYIIIIDDWPMKSYLSFIERDVQMTNGGAPYNIIKNLRAMKVDFPLSLVGLIGNDSNGQWIIDDCLKSNIDIAQLEISKDHTPTSCTYVVSVENTNRRTFFHRQGTNGSLSLKHFDFSKTNAKLFYLGPIMQLKHLDQFDDADYKRTNASKILENAVRFGLETIVDFASAKSANYSLIAKSSLPFIDYLIINEIEAGFIFNQNITSDHLLEIKQIATELIDLGIRKSVTIHFAEGVISVTKDKQVFLQASILLLEQFIKGPLELVMLLFLE
jgi:sugar/nucleoside kinase (ribokinase family)